MLGFLVFGLALFLKFISLGILYSVSLDAFSSKIESIYRFMQMHTVIIFRGFSQSFYYYLGYIHIF